MVAALVGAACGSGSQSSKSAGGGTAGAGAETSQAGTGGAAAGGGASGSGGSAANGGMAGAPGEIDVSCREHTTNHRAGSEIGLRERVTAEGDRAFIGYYDKARGTECNFVRDAEGVMRCFPPVRSQGDARFYLNADCSQAVAYRGICSLDHFTIPASDESCNDRYRVYSFGAPVADGMVWERNIAGECVEHGQINNLHQLGEELVAADYPAVSETTWSGAGRIARSGFEGPGGLRVVRDFRDTELDESCAISTLADGKRYCAPFRLGSFELTDETCQETLLSTRSVCGGPVAKFGSGAAQSCLGSAYVERDQPFTGALSLRGSCQPATAEQTEGAQVFSVKSVPPERFVEMTLVVEESDPGRLKPTYNTSADGACWFQGWYDAEHDVACEFALTTDGSHRCVPRERPLTRAYTDASCTVPVAYYVACSAEVAPKLVSVIVDQDCTETTVEVRPLVASLEGAALPPLWTASGAGCQVFTPSPASTYHQFGDPLPPETFMEAVAEL